MKDAGRPQEAQIAEEETTMLWTSVKGITGWRRGSESERETERR